MKSTMAMTVAILTWSAGEAMRRRPGNTGNASGVPVRVYYNFDRSVTMDISLLSGARMRASLILAQAGIRLEWRLGKPAEDEMGAQVLGIRFVPSVPPALRTGTDTQALAAARPYGKGTTITVFDNRVAAYLVPIGSPDRANVLGHVLAHEIVHVLEGVARHSATGLMTARWTWRELREITRNGLTLAEEDRRLLRIRFASAVAVVAAATEGISR